MGRRKRRGKGRPADPPVPERPGPEAAPAEVPRRRLPAGKRALFAVVAVILFFGLTELVLAVAGVRPVLVHEDPYVGFSSRVKLFQPVNGDASLETAPHKLAFFNRQRFTRAKEPGTFRIFTLGGSTTYGRPFEDETSFSGWLRTYLRRLGGPGRFEVINAGGVSYASYRVALLMEELVEYEPDLFVIYSGHNEFLERRTYDGLIEEPEALTKTRLLLQRTRLWALGQRLVSARQRRARRTYELTGEVKELLDSSAGLEYYFRDDPFERQVLDHYRFNLGRMIRLVRAAGARVILVTVPVNEKDFSPFKSEHGEGVSEAERARHAELLGGASNALDEGRYAQAQELARGAVVIDPLHAHAHYVRGRALSSLGQHEEAGAAFTRAVDEDVCPLRAVSRVNASILEIAGRETVPLVDFRALLKEEMRRRSGHENLGEEFFLDHAHPTVEAHGLLARALVARMGAMGILELAPDWLERVGEEVHQQVTGRVDAEAYARAYKNLSKVLIWAGKEELAEQYVRQASAALEGDWEVHYNAGLVHLDAQRYEEAGQSFREATRLNPRAALAWDQLGSVHATFGELEEAVAAGEKAVVLDPEMAVAWNNLASHLIQRGDLARAEEAARKALALEAEFAEAHNSLGNALFARGQLEEARRSYERAGELRPAFAEALVNEGLVLGEMQRYEQALAAMDEALRHDGSLPAAHLGRGKALLGLRDTTAACASFERVIDLDDGHLEGYELLARCRASSGDSGGAVAILERGIEGHPRPARLQWALGRLRAEEGSYPAAAAAFQAAIATDADLVEAWVDLANLHLVQGRPPDAAAVFRKALERHEGDSRLHHGLAKALLMEDRIEDGLTHLEQALRNDPDNAEVANDLATVLEHLGRLERALGLYRKAAQLDPTLQAARRNATRLSERLGGR
jgi:tetratricopeptide (TPR) repeat protein